MIATTEMSSNDGYFVYNACTTKEGIPTYVTHVKIHASVQEIDDESFKNCTSLKSVDFSNARSLVMIGEHAFAGCKSLEEADLTGLPELRYICHNAFQGCDSLRIIGKLPSKLERIGENAFSAEQGGEVENDSRLADRELDFSSAENLQYIYKGAFAKCKLKAVKVPPKLEAVVDKAFEGSSIQLLDFSSAESLRYIGRDAFASCQIENEIKLPRELEKIDDNAFEGSSVPRIDFSKADSLHKIGSSAFANCNFESEVKFPPKLEELGEEAFAGSSMKRLDFSLAKLLRKIGGWAFARCKIEEDVKFSPTVVGISQRAFARSSMQRLDFSQSESLRVIGQGAFSNCKIEEEVTFPPSLQEIMPYAFTKARMSSADLSNCVELKQLNQSAFDGCECDQMIVLPDSIAEVGEASFRGAWSYNLRRDVMNIQSSFKTIMKYQEAANSVLSDMAIAGIAPRYYVILPPSVPSQEKSGFGSLFKKYSNPQSWVAEKARVCFICPLSHQPVRKSDGTVAYYKVDLPQDWVTKYGPSIQFGLKFVSLGMKVGRCFGLPLQTEDKVAASSEILAGMQQLLVEKLGGNEQDCSLTSLMMATSDEDIEDFKRKFDSAAGAKPELKAKIAESYKGLQEWLGADDDFSDSGLVKATCTKDDSASWVHPDMVLVYEKHGKNCFTMSAERITEEKAILDAKARASPPVDQEPQKSSRQSVAEILESYKGVHERLGADTEFRDSGLVKATCPKGNSSQWVHPGMVGVYERYGNDCFEMSVEMIAEKKAELDSSRELEAMKPPAFKRNLTTSLRDPTVLTKGWLDKKNRGLLSFWKPKWERRFFVMKDDAIIYSQHKFFEEKDVGTKRLSDVVVVKKDGKKDSRLEVRDRGSSRLLLKVRIPKQGSNWDLTRCDGYEGGETEIEKSNTFRSENEAVSTMHSSQSSLNSNFRDRTVVRPTLLD